MGKAVTGIRKFYGRRGISRLRLAVDERLLPAFKPSSLSRQELRTLDDLPSAQDWVPHVNKRESPEKALVQASFLYAIRAIKKGDADAIEWLERGDDKPMGFRWSCQFLEINEDFARENMEIARPVFVRMQPRRSRGRKA